MLKHEKNIKSLDIVCTYAYTHRFLRFFRFFFSMIKSLSATNSGLQWSGDRVVTHIVRFWLPNQLRYRRQHNLCPPMYLYRSDAIPVAISQQCYRNIRPHDPNGCSIFSGNYEQLFNCPCLCSFI